MTSRSEGPSAERAEAGDASGDVPASEGPTATEAAQPAEAKGPTPPPFGADNVRVDKWLWAARMFKTRSQAGKACTAGHVKVNGESVKASKTVRCGDHLEVQTPGGLRILDILHLADKRGSAPVARTLYEDHTPPPPPKEERTFAVRERGTGRPVKKDRRLLIRLRGR